MRRRRTVPGTAACVLVWSVVWAPVWAAGCAPGPSGVPAAQSAPPVAPALPDPGPPPPAEALTGVLSRLADPRVPGADKLVLVAEATPSEAASLDRFAAALRDGGFDPVIFTATEIGWTGQPSTVRATVTVSTTNAADPGDFSFPMEFRSAAGGWQLTRETAEMLLELGDGAPGR